MNITKAALFLLPPSCIWMQLDQQQKKKKEEKKWVKSMAFRADWLFPLQEDLFLSLQ